MKKLYIFSILFSFSLKRENYSRNDWIIDKRFMVIFYKKLYLFNKFIYRIDYIGIKG